MELKEILERKWPEVKRKHLFPQLPVPQLVEGEGDVALEIKSKQISISASFIEQFEGRMAEEEVIEALLDHGITHYMYCPWDFHTHLLLYNEAKKVVKDKEMAQRATEYFIDVVANTYCVKERETKIPELYRHLPKEGVQEVIASLYQEIWGVDLGISGHEDKVRRLVRIPYLEKKRWRESIKKFTKAIEDILQKEIEQERTSEKRAQNPLGDHSFSNYSLEEIDKGLREFASTVEDIQEFKEAVEDLKDELAEKGYTSGGMGRGAGNPIDADLLFYMKLAENYTLPIRKLPMERSGDLHPHSHAPWEIGKPFADIDVWTSFGKIMPGVTQTWVRREGEVYGELESTPDCLIIIDSSGSMTNPRERLSYAVLGAACACNAYLKNDARVAVYNFSDAFRGNKLLLDYCTEKERIYRAICRYFGGGTALDLDDILFLLGQAERSDIFIITDMQITNLEKLIELFNRIDNRVTAVHLGHNVHTARFMEGTKKRKNISLYNVKNKEDIPKIVLGKIREYWASSF